MPRIAILISGRGTNMVALANRVNSGELPAEIAFVAADRPDAPGLEKAQALGLETRCYPYREKGPDRCEREMTKDIEDRGVEWIVLAGFMRILSPGFVSRFTSRIVNIHPSLLPSFPGTHSIEKAWRHGARITGVTVHLVDDQVDHGLILSQAAVSIMDNDSLEDLENRIHETEHQLYWETLRDLFLGKISVIERG
jgi:phosphoribosylglycinamide formyltransferase-1